MTEQIQYTDGVTGPTAPDSGDPGDEHVETPAQEPAEQAAEQKEEAPETETSDDSTEEKPSSGLDFSKYSSEIMENGSLSDDTYKELESAGIPREIVDQYISGTKAMQDQQTKAMYDSVGGEESYNEMIEWASENFSEDEIDAYNKAITTDGASQKFALNGLKARYEAANGRPSLVRGASKKTSSGFRSTAEMVKAMSDPRYKTDPAYRADVENRVKNASF